MKFLFGYEMTHCPLYLESSNDDGLAGHQRDQEIFWSAIMTLVSTRPGLVAELRWVVEAFDRPTKLFVLLSADSAEGTDVPRDLVQPFLPKDFGWRYVGPEAAEQIAVPARLSPREWRVAQLRRKLTVLDLPSVTPWKPRTDNGLYRSMPLDLPTAASMGNFYCIPSVRTLPSEAGDFLQLASSLRQDSPLVVSMAIRGVSARALAHDHPIATILSQWVGRHTELLKKDGFGGGFNEVRQIFERYWLGAGQLTLARLTVAAHSSVAAVSAAQALSRHLGGMECFELLPPGGTSPAVVTPAVLEQQREEVGGGSASTEKDELQQLMAREGVIYDSRLYDDFLFRMRYLYSGKELAWLMRLPAGYEGIQVPGFRGKIVAPFGTDCDAITDDDTPCVRLGFQLGDTPAHENSGTHQRWLSFKVHDMVMHGFIAGDTGSGKTSSIKHILTELTEHNIPFLVIEPIKSQYFDALKGSVKNLRRWRFEGAPDGSPCSDHFSFDPMLIPDHVTVGRHIGYLRSCFEAAFPLDDVLSLLLRNGIANYYRAPLSQYGCGLSKIYQRGGPEVIKLVRYIQGRDENENGVKSGDSKDNDTRKLVHVSYAVPSFRHFREYFKRYIEREFPRTSPRSAEYEEQVRNAFGRRFDLLMNPPFGVAIRLAEREIFEAFSTAQVSSIPPTEPGIESICALKEKSAAEPRAPRYLAGPTVIELDGLTDDDQKSLATAIIFTQIHEYREALDFARRQQGHFSDRNRLEHLLVVEEAHRILGRDAEASRRGSDTVGASARQLAVTQFAQMLAEFRSRGQGVILAEQMPTKIIKDAVANTNLKIMLNLPSEDDREYLGATMRMGASQRHYAESLKTFEAIVFHRGMTMPTRVRIPVK